MALARLSGQHTNEVCDGVYYPEKSCVLSISEDKHLICWLKRDNGHYWPSISQLLPTGATALAFNKTQRRVFVGLESGGILEYTMSEDFNSLHLERSTPAHGGRVQAIAFDAERQYMLSCSRDKSVALHNSLSASLIARHRVSAWMSTLQYDSATQNVFVGDFRGEIHVLKIEGQTLVPVTVLSGHSGSVRSLLWVPSIKFLFSGSYDKTVIAWDIGGMKGVMYELSFHSESVNGLIYVEETKELLSCDEKSVVAWNMGAPRIESPEWQDSDLCQLCNKPFMWNFSEMWARKSFSLNRQHHCRCCGKAICAECSPRTSTHPGMGFELPVIMCKECFPTITDAMKTPLARILPYARLSTMHVAVDDAHMFTIGLDNAIELWNTPDFIEGTGARAASVSAPAAPSAAPARPASHGAYVTGGAASEKTKPSLLDTLNDD